MAWRKGAVAEAWREFIEMAGRHEPVEKMRKYMYDKAIEIGLEGDDLYVYLRFVEGACAGLLGEYDDVEIKEEKSKGFWSWLFGD